jgi:Malic enzyme, NAD binding domain
MDIYATNAKRATDKMFIEAAHAVADQVTPEQLKLGTVYPPQSNILEVEIQIAARVVKLVFDADLGRADRPPVWKPLSGGTFTSPSTRRSCKLATGGRMTEPKHYPTVPSSIQRSGNSAAYSAIHKES